MRRRAPADLRRTRQSGSGPEPQPDSASPANVALATPNPADVRARFPTGESVEVRRRYNVAPGDEVLAVTTDREGNPRGELLRWGLVPSWAKKPGYRAEDDQRQGRDRRRASGLPSRVRALPLPDHRGRVLRVAAPERPGPSRRFTSGGPTAAQFALPACGRSGTTTKTRADVAHVHDHHDRRQLGDRVVARPDAGDPRPRRRGGMAGVLSASATACTRCSPAWPRRETAATTVGPAVNDARYDGPECLAPPVADGQVALF